MLIVVATLGFLLSYYYRLGLLVNPSSVCFGKFSGCENLANLPISQALFDVPNSFWGIVYFCLVIIYTIYNTLVKKIFKPLYYLFLLISVFASFFCLYLTMYQIKINQYCPLCLISSLCVWLSSYMLINNKLMPKFEDTISLYAFVISILLINIAGIVGIGNFYANAGKNHLSDSSLVDVSDSKLKDVVNLETEPFLGVKQPKLTIIEFADPTCPLCKILHEKSLQPLLQEYKDSIKYHYLYAYGHCANGEDFFAILNVCKNLNKYFDCIDLLYHNQDAYYSFSKETGICTIDFDKLKGILDSVQIAKDGFEGSYKNVDKEQLANEVRTMMDLLKIEGTPTLFFLTNDNKRYSIVGVRPRNYLKLLIDKFLK